MAIQGYRHPVSIKKVDMTSKEKYLVKMFCNNWVEIIETISVANPPQIGHLSDKIQRIVNA